MKYSANFTRDFRWLLSVRQLFNFSGKDENALVVYNLKGVDGKMAFFRFDSNGMMVPTRHPNILFTLLKTKASVNLHIKMFAEDRAKGILPAIEFLAWCEAIKAPHWFIAAVESQKMKYYPPEIREVLDKLGI